MKGMPSSFFFCQRTFQAIALVRLRLVGLQVGYGNF
jgi:hypothetical protein